MDDSIGVRLILEHLIGPLTRSLADTGGTVEDGFPSGIVRDFVDD